MYALKARFPLKQDVNGLQLVNEKQSRSRKGNKLDFENFFRWSRLFLFRIGFVHCFSNFQTDGPGQGRRHGVANLQNEKKNENTLEQGKRRLRPKGGFTVAASAYDNVIHDAYLAVLVGYVAEKAVRIGEALRAGALSNAHNAVLLRMQHSTL